MKIYRTRKKKLGNLKVNVSLEGDPLERKIERMINNNEPTSGDGSVAIIYTERADGVEAGYDIRTDRFEIAVDAADKASRGKAARRDGKVIPLEKKEEVNEDGKAESTDG